MDAPPLPPLSLSLPRYLSPSLPLHLSLSPLGDGSYHGPINNRVEAYIDQIYNDRFHIHAAPWYTRSREVEMLIYIFSHFSSLVTFVYIACGMLCMSFCIWKKIIFEVDFTVVTVALVFVSSACEEGEGQRRRTKREVSITIRHYHTSI